MRRINEQDTLVINAVRDAKERAKKTADRLAKLEERQQRITAAVLADRNEAASIKIRLADARAQARHARRRAGPALELEDHLKALEKEQAKVQGAQGAPGPIRRGSGRFIWPVNGTFTSLFGMRWGRLHAGIDIAAPSGTRDPRRGRRHRADRQLVRRLRQLHLHRPRRRRLHLLRAPVLDRRERRAEREPGQVIGAVGSTGHRPGRTSTSRCASTGRRST